MRNRTWAATMVVMTVGSVGLIGCGDDPTVVSVDGGGGATSESAVATTQPEAITTQPESVTTQPQAVTTRPQEDEPAAVVATGPGILVEAEPADANARSAPTVRIKIEGDFPLRDARMFVLVDGQAVGVGGPYEAGVVVRNVPAASIADGAVVSYRWESAPAVEVGSLTTND